MYCEFGLFKFLHDGIRISDSLFLRVVEDLNKLNSCKFCFLFLMGISSLFRRGRGGVCVRYAFYSNLKGYTITTSVKSAFVRWAFTLAPMVSPCKADMV